MVEKRLLDIRSFIEGGQSLSSSKFSIAVFPTQIIIDYNDNFTPAIVVKSAKSPNFDYKT